MPGDQHHRQAFIQSLETGEQLQAVNAGQADVADHNAGEVLADALQRLFSAAYADTGNVFQGQGLLAAEQYMGVVFDDQYRELVFNGFSVCIHVDSAF